MENKIETIIYWGYIGDYLHPSMLSLCCAMHADKGVGENGQTKFQTPLGFAKLGLV